MVNLRPKPALEVHKAETQRLAVLANLQILDTAPEREFDTIAQSAQRLLHCPIALISLVDETRQWFKARCGLATPETPRELAFCAHAVAANDVLIVPDATQDIRFANNPLVTGAPHIRFYAGVPIRAKRYGDDTRLPMGTLCIIDDIARAPDPEQIEILRRLAELVEVLLDARSSVAAITALAEERRRGLEKLDRADRQFRQAERMASIGSWRLTLADNSIEWSDQTYAIHGIPVSERPPLDTALEFYPPHARRIVDSAMARTIETGDPFDFETDFVTAQGEQRRVRSMGEVEMHDAVPVAIIGVFQDITRRHKMEQALRQIAFTDDLTRVASRAHFNTVIDEKISAARNRSQPLALLVIDLDHFKSVNDRCGHQAGDELLRLMAGRLQAAYLADSFVARLGGDEFVLLITAPDILADLPAVLRRLLADMRHIVRDGGIAIDVSATIGACRLTDDIQNRGEFLKRADTALYQAKGHRRGSAVIFGRQEHIVPDGPAGSMALQYEATNRTLSQ